MNETNTSVTVLRTLGPALAKTWNSDGTIADYANAKQFKVSRHAVNGPDALYSLLRALAADPCSCIIRGTPRDTLDPAALVLRRLENFEDKPSHLLMLDIDSYRPIADPIGNPQAAIEEWLFKIAPTCLHGSSFTWQLSGSHGHPTKAGLLRAHLWFWLAEPMTCQQAEAWVSAYLPGVDCTVNRTVQINYTANPVLNHGEHDSCAQRLGFFAGMLDDVLHIPADMPVPEAKARHVRREDLVDPRSKPGVVGAFCRAFSPFDLCTLAPDSFATGSKPERITWLAGGGSPEGVVITDSGTHLYNSHSTAPIKHAANLFDFLRAHLYGHLDAELDPDAQVFAGSALPSYAAMRAFALAQPEMQAALVEDAGEPIAEVSEKQEREVALASSGERARRLDKLCGLIAVTALDQLELELAPHIASERFTYGERARLAAAIQTRSRELVSPHGLPIATIRGWISPTEPTLAAAFPDVDGRGHAVMTIDNVRAVLARLGWIARYNVISKEQELRGPGLSYSTDNFADAALANLVSACVKAGLPYKREAVASYVTVICDESQFNPVAVWIESRPWDEVDRLEALYDTITAAPDFDTANKKLFVRRWLLQCVAVAFSSARIQARGVLTFAGKQYIGKTKWLQSLCRGHEHLLTTGRLLDPHAKDSVRTAISHWLCELGELDGTLRRADMASLKAFLSQDADRFRLPYAAKDSTFQRRTSFFASVNHENFLIDTTGNTRFWPIPVLALNHEHDIDMQQLWAQVLQLYREGEPYWMSADEMSRVGEASHEHQAEDPIQEAIETRFAFDMLRPDGSAEDGVTWEAMTATQVAKRIGRLTPTRSDVARIGLLLRERHVSKEKRTAIRKGWKMPVRPNDNASFTELSE